METIKLTIFDETLRDGEHQVGIFFDHALKQSLAQLIIKTGVDYLALMPAIHDLEASLVKSLIQEGFQQQIVASTMLGEDAINYAIECGVNKIILFYPVSDRLLWLRDPEIRSHPQYQHTEENPPHPPFERGGDDDIPKALITQIRERMLAKVLTNLQFCASKGLKVCFAAEDASRADFDFLVDCIQSFSPYIEDFILCDTVGILTPEKTYIWLHNIRQFTPQIPLIVHFHNDFGLALENTIQAVRAGAAGISGTFNGIGERAGNVAIEQVLYGLKLRFGWEVAGIDYDAVAILHNYMENLGIRANAPYSQAARRYETGIHVNSILRDRASYYPFATGEPEIWFGKCSGASNFQYLFEEYLQQPLSKEEYQKLRAMVKEMAIDQKRSFSVQEILELLRLI